MMVLKYCATHAPGQGIFGSWQDAEVAFGSGIGGQMDNEGYKPWRHRWLRLHSRSLLANALPLEEAELGAYLTEMLTVYRNYGDFTENEIDFMFRRVCRGIQRLPVASHGGPDSARRARKRIRALGQRLSIEAACFKGRAP